MKEKDLFVDFKQHPLVLYVEKEDGSYGQMVSGSYISKNYLEDYFDKIKKWDKNLKDQLSKGEISPVYYYMIMRQLGEGDLASRVKISKRKLRKHFKMEHFEKMSLAMLRRYADAFDVPVSSMLHFIVVNEKDGKAFSISHLESKNPYFLATKIERA